jgi:hypothetical protein
MKLEEGREGHIDQALKRLERAANLLEQRISRRIAEADSQSGSAVDADRARLAAELDAARGRERDLEAAGAEASKALDNAIAQLRAALEDHKEG